MEQVPLQPVDEASVTILVDNFVDILMAGDEVALRPGLSPDVWERDKLRAEHGYSLLVTVTSGDRTQSILYDVGLGRDTALHNMDVLEIRPADLRAIVLSHGHADHHAGLEGVARRLGRPGLPLVLHPDAWRQRRIVFPTGAEIPLPPPNRADLASVGVEVIDERGPSLLLDGTVLVSGQTERTTPFETGMPVHQVRADDGWEPDPWIWDDQAVIVHVRGKGLVVLSSCSHSGAVNVLLNARALTGVDKIHAFVGGMHLTGGLFDARIPDTVAAFTDLAPDVVVPGHCSGWKAIHTLARALPDAFVCTSVGTRLRFAAPV